MKRFTKKKRWFYCPECRSGRQMIQSDAHIWNCSKCNYEFHQDNLFKSYGFWLCDYCGSVLNVQSTFKKESPQNVCTVCGRSNETSAANIYRACIGCGKPISGMKKKFCPSCNDKNRERRNARIDLALSILGTGASIFQLVSTEILAEHNNKETNANQEPKNIKAMTDEELNAYRDEVQNTWKYQENGPEREKNWDLMTNIIDNELRARKDAEFFKKYPDGKVPKQVYWSDAERWEKD